MVIISEFCCIAEKSKSRYIKLFSISYSLIKINKTMFSFPWLTFLRKNISLYLVKLPKLLLTAYLA